MEEFVAKRLLSVSKAEAEYSWYKFEDVRLEETLVMGQVLVRDTAFYQ
jgi:hypothetical protein